MFVNDDLVNVVASSSKGNFTVIDNCIAIDLGVPYKTVKPYAKKLKLVLLTHEHS